MKFLAATTMQTECRVMLQAAARRMLVSVTSCAVGIIPKSSICDFSCLSTRIHNGRWGIT